MATIVSWNGLSYSVPAIGEENWGGATKVDGLLISLAQNGLQKSGGNFTLSGDVDFGGTAGLKVAYLSTRTANPSTAGLIRLANTESIGWRNAANGANLLLSVDSSNNLTYNGAIISSSGGVVPVAAGGTGFSSYTIGDTLYASGATAFSKLAIGAANTVNVSTGSAPSWALLVNANISGSAAIAYSKLTLTGLVVNADIGASAAIAYSKLAALTASRLLVSDGSGFVAVSAVTSTEAGFIAGLTSSAVGTTQTQTLSGKTLSDSLGLTQIATPSTPSSGFNKLYTKSGNTLNWLDSSGVEHVAMDTTTSAYTLKNLIINGGFDFFQRATLVAGVASGGYVADRFTHQSSCAAVVTVARSTDVPTLAQSGFQSSYSLIVDCTTADASIAAGDSSVVLYRMEGADYALIKGKTVTLSFWVKSTKTGIFCVGFQNGGADRSYVAEYTVLATNTWEKKTITLTLNPSGGTDNFLNGLVFQIAFSLVCGSTYQTTAGSWQTGNFYATSNQVNGMDSTANDFLFAQVCLNLGSTAIAFNRSGDTLTGELEACQRYYEKSFDMGILPGAASAPGLTNFRASITATNVFPVYYKVRKRTTPTPHVYSTAGTIDNVRSSTPADVAASYSNTGETCFTLSFSGTDGTSYTWQWTADAEL